MPQISQNASGGKIVFNETDWLAGLHPQYSVGLLNNQKMGNYLATGKNFNPYRYLGYASPGFNPKDVTNVSAVTAALRSSVINGGYGYATSNNSLLHRIEALTTNGQVTNAGSFPHTIDHAHASEVGDDVAFYTAKVGGTSAPRLFYSFADATDWDVGVYDYSATFDDDFMSTAPATPLAAPYITGGVGKPHPLMVGDDDILYIGDRNFVHAYDGANAADADGKFFAAALTLPSGYIITSFSRIDNFLVIFAYQSNAGTDGSTGYYYGDAKAFFWDYLSLDPTRIVSLNDNYVSEGFEYKGSVACFTSGRQNQIDSIGTRLSHLQIFNGSIFEPVSDFIDAPPIRGGVEVKGDVITWNSAGKIYSYGSPFQGFPVGLTHLCSGSGTTSGLLKTFTSTLQLASTGATTDGGLQRFNTEYASSSIAASVYAEPYFPTRQQGRVKSVKIRFGKTSSAGRNLTLTLYDRATSSSTVISTGTNLSAITAANMVKEYELNSSGNPFPTFEALRLILEWEGGSAATDAPVVAIVEIEYENVAIVNT